MKNVPYVQGVRDRPVEVGQGIEASDSVLQRRVQPGVLQGNSSLVAKGSQELELGGREYTPRQVRGAEHAENLVSDFQGHTHHGSKSILSERLYGPLRELQVGIHE